MSWNETRRDNHAYLEAAPRTGIRGDLRWKQILHERIACYGHRNWIVIADSAYPSQSAEGIETLLAGCGQMEVLSEVMDAIRTARHLSAVFHRDLELSFIREDEVPGVTAFRMQSEELLRPYLTQARFHEQIIKSLSESALLFRVLVIKTESAIPYSTLFCELQCGYWSESLERKLRESMTAVE